jgi:hypothetical protein
MSLAERASLLALRFVTEENLSASKAEQWCLQSHRDGHNCRISHPICLNLKERCRIKWRHAFCSSSLESQCGNSSLLSQDIKPL